MDKYVPPKKQTTVKSSGEVKIAGRHENAKSRKLTYLSNGQPNRFGRARINPFDHKWLVKDAKDYNMAIADVEKLFVEASGRYHDDPPDPKHEKDPLHKPAKPYNNGFIEMCVDANSGYIDKNW